MILNTRQLYRAIASTGNRLFLLGAEAIISMHLNSIPYSPVFATLIPSRLVVFTGSQFTCMHVELQLRPPRGADRKWFAQSSKRVLSAHEKEMTGSLLQLCINQFTRLRAEEFYDDFINEPYFETMIQYMMRYPLIALETASMPFHYFSLLSALVRGPVWGLAIYLESGVLDAYNELRSCFLQWYLQNSGESSKVC